MSVPSLAGHGFSVNLHAGWEGRISQRPLPSGRFTGIGRAAPESAGLRTEGARLARAASTAAVGPVPGADGWLGEQPMPVLHLANFALPADRGDYGSGAVERMGRTGVFIALLQFGPECLGTALFRPRGMPRVEPERFDPNGLQRRLPGQAGAQYFFTYSTVPMCLYVVLGAHSGAAALSPQVNSVLAGVTVAPR